MKRQKWIGVVLMVALALAGVTNTHAQNTDRQYFRETGHSVSGDFLTYYHSEKDATLLFGYPITEQFSENGQVVQYFQRARFELHPELPDGQRVQLTSLGRATYIPGNQISVYTPFSCRLFSETGYAVCYAFMDFFNAHGGVAQFGYPISPFQYQDNLIVQYFEKARFEWRPSLPEGQRVGLTDLGRIYFDLKKEDVNLLKPIPFSEIGAQSPLSLQVRAFSWKAVTLASDQQLVYVVVQDQTLQPVSGAVGTATIRWPNGTSEVQSIITNSNGFGVVPLSFTNLPYGSLVYIDIAVSKDGLTSSTTTSFRIWY